MLSQTFLDLFDERTIAKQRLLANAFTERDKPHHRQYVERKSGRPLLSSISAFRTTSVRINGAEILRFFSGLWAKKAG
ncbi:hypothetical protein C7U92_14460 [Bradyrhizobium sp. WBOS7]|uniref:Uncharacterized protein n=1 Tax=Bradyrhizobium betae TaxID=244734 RepID=A0AAE9NBE3_9BRAD|nr:hypothetical protein [Bradyrhizobium sp. WBOS2]MDD1571604.1 hypothetical protein [Bradyrhizobium sp. WBOS1]MDD1577926.1 hypothetical protein [Bradyrhizobium sp. WBOS7]MDD1599964.1 hypothetical protein [Bradyrhizobium sp. WBOS16]UUO37316.1 hypothetical protein DCK84_23915 [Bradyrhizobium sp. WBOS01]UUO43619.1 hypothetical protein DCM75_24670 [Bradyrhizobium sp. WBOS02]UUO53552.1 hypothetical protein DCM79_11565 [Bradyrhizobium sp. WBOS07]UUO67556.1 hypothetical protein DCM83_21675 [Bradyrh